MWLGKAPAICYSCMAAPGTDVIGCEAQRRNSQQDDKVKCAFDSHGLVTVNKESF